jgi:hypothetical protein
MLKLLLTYLAICTILASTSSFAETPEPENNPISEPSKDRTIEPGKSFFVCPIGATEEEVIKKLGKPTGKLTPNKQRSSLLYGQNCMLEFWSGKLIGVSISRERSFGKLESEEDGDWTLSNGIRLGMNLAEIKKIRGEIITEGRNFHNVSYEDEGSLVLLRFSSKGSTDTKDLDAYELYGITIKSAAPFSIDPSRSFFDCEIGSTQEEVISKLGQPLRRYDLHDGKTAFIYGEDCALLFWNNRLGGIDLQGEGSIHGELSKKSGRDYIDGSPKTFFKYNSTPETKYLWQLKNGMRPGMDLEQAKTILGDKFPAKVDKVLRYQEGDTLVTFRVSEQKLGSVHMEPAVIERSDKLTIDPAKSIFGCPIGSTPEEVISKLGEPIGTHNLGHGKSALVYGADCALLFWDGRLRGLALEGNGNLIHFGRFLEESLPDAIHIQRFASYHIGGANYGENVTYFDMSRPHDEKFGFPRYSWRLTNGLHSGMHLEKAKLILGDKFPEKVDKTLCYQDGNTLVTFQVSDQKLGSVYLEPAIGDTSDGLVIDPSKSIFGCPIGSSSAEVVSKMGPPICSLDFMNGLTALIYSNDCAMLFWNKKLGGIQFGYGIINTHREKFAQPNLLWMDINVASIGLWSFPNGIMSGMLWNEAKGRLAGKELRFERDNIVSFDDGPSTVTLFLHHPIGVDDPKDRKIGAIRIQPTASPRLDTELTLLYEQLAEKKPLKDKTIVPGKSFFGCQISATEQQVITKLGKPAAKIDSGNGEFSLLYGPGCAMEFWNGKLGGVTILNENFNLSNGVTSGMNLAEIQKKLGDRFTGPTTTYREGSSLVRITALLNPDSDRDNYANYSLSELRIEPVEKYLNLDSKNSIFDSKFGSTPEEVISKLGQPNGKYRLSDSKSFFLYGQSYLLMFDNNKLQAIAVESFFPDSIESRPSISHFSPITGDWQLKNGLRKGMELDRANDILGDKNREKERGSVFYREEDSTVNISLSEIESKKELWSIYIESSTDRKDNHLTIDPGKSIFGCELGSSPDEVIKRLGQPLGKINLKNGRSALVLREKCFLTFSDEKLVGAEIYSSDYISGEGSRFINENSSESDYHKFRKKNMSLVNGIKIGMPLAEAKKRLGIKEKVNLHDPLKYTDGPSEVSLGLRTQFDDEGTIISSIKIAPKHVKSK